MHRKVFSGHFPPFRGVAILHQSQQIDKSVGSEREHAQRVLVVLLKNVLIRANPCIGVPFLCKRLIVRAERKFLKQTGTVMPTAEESGKMGQYAACPPCIVVTRTSADEKGIDGVIVALGI